MAKPTTVVVLGYMEVAQKLQDSVQILTLAGRRISIPTSSIISQHILEGGHDESGPFRFFVEAGTLINAEISVSDLLEGETHWSSDTALRKRSSFRSESFSDDGETHFSHDTA